MCVNRLLLYHRDREENFRAPGCDDGQQELVLGQGFYLRCRLGVYPLPARGAWSTHIVLGWTESFSQPCILTL
jgi:hypothetical protein